MRERVLRKKKKMTSRKINWVLVHKRDRKIQNGENETENQSISQANSLILLRRKLQEPRRGSDLAKFLPVNS